MITILKGRSKEVVIDTEGPVVIIGESINPTRRKKLVSTLQEHNFDFVLELAKNQIDEGADVLDVNVGFPGVDDVKLLPETVKVLQDNFDVPLCLDSPNPAAIEAALRAAEGKCLINSVNGEERSLQSLLPIAREFGAAIIGLCMDDDGITHDPDKRLSIAEKIIERAVREGIKAEDVIIDPLAMAVSADPRACIVTLETIRLVHQELGHNITQGASNISFGLPDRESLNAAYMAMSIFNGLTCPIANPEKITSIVRAADLVLGRDDYAVRFVDYFQRRQ
ncbi:MAG TPA: dihydropteroate synthase [Bacteroidales bacterium]|jgi:5-methyltetrahydrofolate--homocysteine methyltransferase|nr:dihydropteroate synthase [Bacteroidales bacterium]OQB61793.1 MAG: 5-methyltetrahydrofolate:corrinoid/iron-sulfur protein co-methyltransferase [Bacteroidetes bacterium ADurb.Bin145]NMD02656.1 dihydropteroate synthase [Bacteroidales bacterium]HOU01844.1 dihydropteroate synthase [Bacteroidales bacterium]HQG63471.1 dihydropteroate synthase [Bacteroidales bacterium]